MTDNCSVRDGYDITKSGADQVKTLLCGGSGKLSTMKVTREQSNEASQHHCQHTNGHVTLCAAVNHG